MVGELVNYDECQFSDIITKGKYIGWRRGRWKGQDFMISQELLDDSLFDLEKYVDSQVILNKLNQKIDNYNRNFKL